MAGREDCIVEDATKLEEGCSAVQAKPDSDTQKDCCPSVLFIQKIIAEMFGTYCVIFSGCGSVVVNDIYGKVTFPGVCITWGLIVMVMVYSLGHISGAHFNPAVTLAFAIFRRFPWKEVPAYMVAQVLGSVMASGTLHLLFDVKPSDYFGTVPAGTAVQSFAIEIIISFILMFVISGVATDTRAAHIWSFNEPSQKPRAGNCYGSLQRLVGLHSWSSSGHSAWRLCIQPH